MFDSLSTSLEKAWDIVRKDGKLTEDNIKGPMREIRRALLEADVSPLSRRGANQLGAVLLLLCCSDHTGSWFRPVIFAENSGMCCICRCLMADLSC